MKTCPAGAEFFHADGRTDRHDEENSRFSQFCENHLKTDWYSVFVNLEFSILLQLAIRLSSLGQYGGPHLLTHSLEHSPSWEANRFSASQEIPHILWNPNVRNRVYKCPPLHILSQIDPILAPHPTSWRSILTLWRRNFLLNFSTPCI